MTKKLMLILLSFFLIVLISACRDSSSHYSEKQSQYFIDSAYTHAGFIDYFSDFDAATEWGKENRQAVYYKEASPKSTYIFFTQEEWNDFRNQYLRGASLIPIIDLENPKELFEEYDLIYVSTEVANANYTQGYKVSDTLTMPLGSDENVLNVYLTSIPIKAINSNGFYNQFYSLIFIEKGLITLGTEIKVNYLEAEKPVENEKFKTIFSGLIFNSSYFGTLIIENESEWQSFKEENLPNIQLDTINFDDKSLVISIMHYGAKPTLSSPFTISDVKIEDGTFDLKYKSEPIHINNQLYYGISIIEVDKEDLVQKSSGDAN